MTSKKSRAVGPFDEARLDEILEALEALNAGAPSSDRRQWIERVRKIREQLRILGDETNVRVADSDAMRFFDFNVVQPPRAGRLDTFLQAVSSVLTVMPDPIPSRHPWARDIAALRGDFSNIARDAWVVIARQENDRRRQEG